MRCAGTDEKIQYQTLFWPLDSRGAKPIPAWHLIVQHQLYFPIRWAALAQDCKQKQRNERRKACIIPIRDALGELGNHLDFSERICHLSQEASVGATPRVELCCYALEMIDHTPNGTHVFSLGSINVPTESRISKMEWIRGFRVWNRVSPVLVVALFLPIGQTVLCQRNSPPHHFPHPSAKGS